MNYTVMVLSHMTIQTITTIYMLPMSPQQGWNSLYNLTFEYFVSNLFNKGNYVLYRFYCFYKAPKSLKLLTAKIVGPPQKNSIDPLLALLPVVPCLRFNWDITHYREGHVICCYFVQMTIFGLLGLLSQLKRNWTVFTYPRYPE